MHPFYRWLAKLRQAAAPRSAITTPTNRLGGTLCGEGTTFDAAGYETTGACPAYAYNPKRKMPFVVAPNYARRGQFSSARPT